MYDFPHRPEISEAGLVLAARYGNVEHVKQCLQWRTMSPDAVDETGRTALWAAIEGQHVQIIQMLLQRGARIDKVSAGDNHPLVGLMGLHQADCRSLLPKRLKGVVDPAYRDCKGRSLLHRAALSRCLSMMKPLMQLGIDVNVRDDMHRTPLHWAVFKGLHTILALTELGADIDAEDKWGLTPLQAAAGHADGNDDALRSAYALVALGARTRGIFSKDHRVMNEVHEGSRLECAVRLLHADLVGRVLAQPGTTPAHIHKALALLPRITPQYRQDHHGIEQALRQRLAELEPAIGTQAGHVASDTGIAVDPSGQQSLVAQA